VHAGIIYAFCFSQQAKGERLRGSMLKGPVAAVARAERRAPPSMDRAGFGRASNQRAKGGVKKRSVAD
jgi:hypothetical protein